VGGTSIAALTRALAIGEQCGALGARVRTICYLTGLERKTARRFFSGEQHPVQCGNYPSSSADWLYKINLFGQIEASLLVSIFSRLRDHGIGDAEALITAFRQYHARFGHLAQIDFDRAFDLVSHCCGIWTHAVAALALYSCKYCGSEFLSSLGNCGGGQGNCPFCKVLGRYSKEERIRRYFESELQSASGFKSCRNQDVELRRRGLLTARRCRELGARVRTICYVAGLSRKEVQRICFDPGDTSPSGRHPASRQWLSNGNLFERVEASVLLAIAGRLKERGVGEAEALITGFRQYQQHFPDGRSIDFNRAFDLVSRAWGIWAEPRVDLTLETCTDCGSMYAVVPNPDMGAEECPFCQLIHRFPKEARVRMHFARDDGVDALPAASAV
jgi:flagellar transcriptional activator FlhC